MSAVRPPHSGMYAAYVLEAVRETASRQRDAPARDPAMRDLGRDCGYQDVACWERQLRAAGWRPWNCRTGQESRGSTTWKSPQGLFYRGPYGAWTVMKATPR